MEPRPFKRDGHAEYGRSYDAGTDTTHVTLLGEDETGYDPHESESPARAS